MDVSLAPGCLAAGPNTGRNGCPTRAKQFARSIRSQAGPTYHLPDETASRDDGLIVQREGVVDFGQLRNHHGFARNPE